MNTKTLVAFASILLAPVFSAQAAPVTVKLTDVHLCCSSCVKDADDAVAAIPGATAFADLHQKAILITAPDQATAQKAVDALVAAGYYGSSSDATVKQVDFSAVTDAKVRSLTVEGVHLCCDKCSNTAKKALAAVPGVTGDTASKDSNSFVITGDFSPKEAMAALNRAGLTGAVAKTP